MPGEQVLPILHYKHTFHTGSVPSNLHVSVPIHSGLSDPAGLQGCRAVGLDFSEGASSAATSLVVHVKIVWHLWGTASLVDSIVWSYFDSLENCHKGLLSGDSGHVGD